MKYLIMIGLVIGMAVFMLLNKNEVEKFDLESQQNKIEQVEIEVNRAIEESQDKINDALNN